MQVRLADAGRRPAAPRPPAQLSAVRVLVLQSLLQAHDSIAEKEMEPEAPPTQGETLTQWGGETAKVIRIEKAKDVPLVTPARALAAS